MWPATLTLVAISDFWCSTMNAIAGYLEGAGCWGEPELIANFTYYSIHLLAGEFENSITRNAEQMLVVFVSVDVFIPGLIFFEGVSP